MPYPRGKKHTKEHNEKISKAMSELMKSPESKKKISQSLKEYYKENPVQNERNRKIDKSVTEYWKTHPEAKKKASRKHKQTYKEKPELRKNIDRVMTNWWKQNPEKRKALSRKMKEFYAKNPKALDEFLKHGKNPLKTHIRTKQGFLVRSKGEKQIANFLHDKSIPCLYESISLPITTKPYAGNICTPDFYIPEWNIFIEFYGGYPSAWKKKVLKNKLYPAHKIPVLAITPSELGNLGYYLIKQGEKLSRTAIAKQFKIRKWVK